MNGTRKKKRKKNELAAISNILVNLAAIKKVWVNEPCLLGGVMVEGEKRQTQVERWIPNFQKYNSNSGWVCAHDPYDPYVRWEDVAQALSHLGADVHAIADQRNAADRSYRSSGNVYGWPLETKSRKWFF